jgi:hypothetical protein
MTDLRCRVGWHDYEPEPPNGPGAVNRSTTFRAYISNAAAATIPSLCTWTRRTKDITASRETTQKVIPDGARWAARAESLAAIDAPPNESQEPVHDDVALQRAYAAGN